MIICQKIIFVHVKGWSRDDRDPLLEWPLFTFAKQVAVVMKTFSGMEIIIKIVLTTVSTPDLPSFSASVLLICVALFMSLTFH